MSNPQPRPAQALLQAMPSRSKPVRLGRPTRLPTVASPSLLGRYLVRLNWLFGTE